MRYAIVANVGDEFFVWKEKTASFEMVCGFSYQEMVAFGADYDLPTARRIVCQITKTFDRLSIALVPWHKATPSNP